ncbi:MAG: sulfite exporter TauE/SafE family protein [Ignavibacteriales bacterium]
MIALIIGIAAGIISGMGIGGGTILIPALVIFLGIEQHNAQGVNLAFFIPTAVAALIIHIKNKNIHLKTASQIIIWGIIGAVLGAYIAVSIPSLILKKMFGFFMLFMGIYEIFKGAKTKSEKTIN